MIIDKIGAGDRAEVHRAAQAGLLIGAEVHGSWDFHAQRPHVINPRTGLEMPEVFAEADWQAYAEKHHLKVNWETLWHDGWENLVVTQGRNHILDSTFDAATQFTTWYIALLKTLGGSPVAGDVYSGFMGTGNEEVTAYDEANRQTFTVAAASAGSSDNVGNEAVFTIDSNGTVIGGGALVSFAGKGDSAEASQVMYSAGAFTAGDKSLDDNDTVTVELTLSVTAA